MAKDYLIDIDGHPSIYLNENRKLRIYFSEPEAGANEETGILLLIAGFGGNANSKVYSKIRSQFADQYNLVTVQCDYFGWEFMQDVNQVTFNINRQDIINIFKDDELQYVMDGDKVNITRLMEIGSKYGLQIPGFAVLNEKLSNFNDMGIMQAIDNITAVAIVMAIMSDNNINFNKNKIIAYGHSHGAYLSHLCNIFAPNLFSLIIDNSSWLFPAYLKNNRNLYSKVNNVTIVKQFDYLAKNISIDEELLNLSRAYSKAFNKAKIICFQGTTDSFISYKDKELFCSCIENCLYNEISADKVDGVIFKSTNHGLDANFIKLFEFVMKDNTNIWSVNSEKKPLLSLRIETSNCLYNIDYSIGIPLLTRYINQ